MDAKSWCNVAQTIGPFWPKPIVFSVQYDWIFNQENQRQNEVFMIEAYLPFFPKS
jgi:hypothetical protein